MLLQAVKSFTYLLFNRLDANIQLFRNLAVFQTVAPAEHKYFTALRGKRVYIRHDFFFQFFQ